MFHYRKLKALFGKPAYETKDMEYQYEYYLEATDEQEETRILRAYSGPSGPSIGGLEDEKSRLAAEALIEKIREAKPVDYEYEGYYLDGPSRVRHGVKNGEPFWEEEEMDPDGEELREAYKIIYSP